MFVGKYNEIISSSLNLPFTLVRFTKVWEFLLTMFRLFQSEKNGFSQFHGYVCAAFLRMWSKQLQAEKDFQVF